MAADLVDHHADNEVRRQDSDISSNFLFDPKAFQDAHGELELDKYQLCEEDLLQYGIMASKIRANISEEALRFY